MLHRHQPEHRLSDLTRASENEPQIRTTEMEPDSDSSVGRDTESWVGHQPAEAAVLADSTGPTSIQRGTVLSSVPDRWARLSLLKCCSLPSPAPPFPPPPRAPPAGCRPYDRLRLHRRLVRPRVHPVAVPGRGDPPPPPPHDLEPGVGSAVTRSTDAPPRGPPEPGGTPPRGEPIRRRPPQGDDLLLHPAAPSQRSAPLGVRRPPPEAACGHPGIPLHFVQMA